MAVVEPLKAQAVAAFKWSTLSALAGKAITPLVFLVLAHVLMPEDFGVAAIATITISFSQVFWDLGLSKTLIQRQGDVEAAASIVFWTNVGLGLLIYAILFLASDWVAHLLGDARVGIVLRVQGVQIIIGSLSSVHVALFQRALDFRTLFWISLFASGAPGLASIPLAWFGFGYWALVIGTLFGSLAQLLLLWYWNSWRPRLRYDVRVARTLMHFGFWVAGEGLLVWAYSWLDSITVGIYLGSHDLGLYRAGSAFLTSIFMLLVSPLMPVLYSSFARLQHDPQRLSRALLNSNKLIAMLALPAGAGIFLLADPLRNLVFGAAWAGIEPVIGILGLVRGATGLNGSNDEAYRAAGRPDVTVKLALACLAAYVPSYLLAAAYGLSTFLWTRLAIELLAQPVIMLVAQHVVGLRVATMLREYRWIFAASLVMGGVVVFADQALRDAVQSWLRCLLLIGVGATIYGLIIYFGEKRYIRMLLNHIRPRSIILRYVTS